MTRDVSNYQDIIDVRDVTSRVEELEDKRQALVDALEEAEEEKKDKARIDLELWDENEDGDELTTLTALLDDLRGNGGDHKWRGDWYPISLIRESYFEDYCMELVEDIGDLPKDLPGYLVIDWEATARNLRVDYSEVDYGGESYLYR